MCEEFILNSLSADNVCQIFETADKLQMTQLRDICFKWILNNFGDVITTNGYTEMDKRLLQEVNITASEIHFPNKKRKTMNTTENPH
jgi:hypothetical protein